MGVCCAFFVVYVPLDKFSDALTLTNIFLIFPPLYLIFMVLLSVCFGLCYRLCNRDIWRSGTYPSRNWLYGGVIWFGILWRIIVAMWLPFLVVPNGLSMSFVTVEHVLAKTLFWVTSIIYSICSWSRSATTSAWAALLLYRWVNTIHPVAWKCEFLLLHSATPLNIGYSKWRQLTSVTVVYLIMRPWLSQKADSKATIVCIHARWFWEAIRFPKIPIGVAFRRNNEHECFFHSTNMSWTFLLLFNLAFQRKTSKTRPVDSLDLLEWSSLMCSHQKTDRRHLVEKFYTSFHFVNHGLKESAEVQRWKTGLPQRPCPTAAVNSMVTSRWLTDILSLHRKRPLADKKFDKKILYGKGDFC